MLEPWKDASAAADGLSNAKIAITRMGRYRNANTTIAQAVKARFAVRTLRTEPLLLRGEQDVHDHEHRQRRHQADRERRAEGLVLRFGERIPDHVPDELVLPTSQDVRDDVLTGHRDEDEQRTGDDAGKREPERDLPERLERPRAQVRGGFDARPIHPFQPREPPQGE